MHLAPASGAGGHFRGGRRKGSIALSAERTASGVPRLPFDGVASDERARSRPGPRLGKALRAARLAWEAGEATTAEQALAAAREALGEG